jgi:hypothetical protein
MHEKGLLVIVRIRSEKTLPTALEILGDPAREFILLTLSFFEDPRG